MLTRDLVAKISEQIERTDHLIALVPAGSSQWAPPIPEAWTMGELLGHLLDCLAGFCAVLCKAEPDRLRHLEAMRDLPVNHACDPSEARERIAIYRRHIEEGCILLNDADLARRLPTIFVPAGETVMTLLLGNLEHLINHKHQLFTYLKLMGANVNSGDLYRFRG